MPRGVPTQKQPIASPPPSTPAIPNLPRLPAPAAHPAAPTSPATRLPSPSSLSSRPLARSSPQTAAARLTLPPRASLDSSRLSASRARSSTRRRLTESDEYDACAGGAVCEPSILKYLFLAASFVLAQVKSKNGQRKRRRKEVEKSKGKKRERKLLTEIETWDIDGHLFDPKTSIPPLSLSLSNLGWREIQHTPARRACVRALRALRERFTET